MDLTEIPRDVFFITSVINTGDKPWSYSKVRSVYTADERFEQTLETIASIRMYAENPFIIHVECSDISPTMTQQLQERVDVFLQCKDIPAVSDVCLHSHKKGHGEVMQTLQAVKFIEEHAIRFNRLFKITGRYHLTERFSSSAYPMFDYGFSVSTRLSQVNTAIYSVPFHKLRDFKNVLLECERIYQTENPCLEKLMHTLCNPTLHVSVLGIAGRIGVDRSHLLEA